MSCVPYFQSVALTWQRMDGNKGKALLAHYLEQSDQKDMPGHNYFRRVISEMYRAQEMDDEDYVRVDESKDELLSAPKSRGIRYENIGKRSGKRLEEVTRM